MADDVELYEIPGMELFSVGCWNRQSEDDCYTRQDLLNMVRANQEVNWTPVLKIGHSDNQRPIEYPNVGKLKNLRVVGDVLYGDAVAIPARIYRLIKSGLYNRVSAEVVFGFTDESTGKRYKHLFRGLALLGESMPALTNLRDVESLLYKHACECSGACECGTRTVVYARDNFGRVYTLRPL